MLCVMMTLMPSHAPEYLMVVYRNISVDFAAVVSDACFFAMPAFAALLAL